MKYLYQIRNKIYFTIKEAAEDIGISYSALMSRFNRYRRQNNFPFGWGYIND